MKKVSARAVIALILAAAVVLGLVWFVVQYARHAEDWVYFSGSPHVYANGNLSTGTITDRDGTVLLQHTDSGRVYTADPTLAASVIHLLGDREGYVAAPILSAYARQMVGYSPITGLSGQQRGDRTMELTLSAPIQAAAYEALAGRRGTVGVYNYKTGEILCMVSSPAYPPDAKPEIDESDPAWEGVYVNRFTNSVYPPGSIFKLVTLAAALETLPDAESLTFPCSGSTIIGGVTVTCHEAHGTVDLKQALADSCNCAFGQLAVMVGADTLQACADALGIGQGLALDGITTAAGHFDLSQADQGALAWAGIGQYTDQVNPCQYLTVLGAIAGGGTAAQPYVVSRIKTPLGRRVYQAEPVLTQSVLSPRTAQIIADAMAYSVETVYGADNFGGLTVCAKTGTAELGGGAADNAMFAGFVRDDSCPVAFFIAVENAGYGVVNCVPIASAVLAACRTSFGS